MFGREQGKKSHTQWPLKAEDPDPNTCLLFFPVAGNSPGRNEKVVGLGIA